MCSRDLGRLMPPLLGIYLAFKIGDMVIRESFVYLTDLNHCQRHVYRRGRGRGGRPAADVALSGRPQVARRCLFTAALLVVLGVLLSRINTFITAYTPPYSTHSYFPSFGEISVTVGFIALLMLAYRFVRPELPGDQRSGRVPVRPRRSTASGGPDMTIVSTLRMSVGSLRRAPRSWSCWRDPGRSRQQASRAAPHALPAELRNRCAMCHTCTTPTKSDPCLITCPRVKESTGMHTPADGPGVILMDKMPGQYGPVVFNHRVHAQMAEMSGGCYGCHHYNDTASAILSCTDLPSGRRGSGRTSTCRT